MMAGTAGRRQSAPQYAILIAAEIALALFILVPMAWMFSVSLKPNDEPFTIPPTFWPDKPTLDNYRAVWQPQFRRYFLNSAVVSLATIAVCLPAALLAAYGFRTTNGPGQHEALGRYLRAVLDKPPAEKAAREFDRLRRARNQDRYEAKPVGAAATEKAEQVARTLLDAALARGLSP